MFRVAVALTSVAAASDSAPSSLAWKPHDKDDAQLLIAGYDAANVAAEAEVVSEAAQRQKLSLAKKQAKKPVVSLAKKQVKKHVNPLLEHYLSTHHEGGASYSTKWTVTPRKATAIDQLKKLDAKKDAPNNYMNELYGDPIVSAPAPKQLASKVSSMEYLAPSNAGAPFSKLISGDMREVVVQAQQMFGDKQKKQVIDKVLHWSDPRDEQRANEQHVLASNAQMTSHVDAAKSDANPYMHFLASRKDQVALEAQAAESKANSALSHSGDNGYMRTILPDADYISLAK